MPLTVQFTPLADAAGDFLIVGVWEDEPLSPAVAELDARVGGALDRLRQAGDLTGKAGELTPLLDRTGVAAGRLLVVGLGKRAAADRLSLISAFATALRSVTGKQRQRVALAVPEGEPNLAPEEVARAVGVGALQGCHGPGLYKKEPDRFEPKELVLVAGAAAAQDALRQGTRRADVEGRAVALARHLVNLPPCDLYPETFAERARAVAGEANIECTIFDEKRLEAERMGSLLGVARGSERPARLVVLRYRGGGSDRPLAWIGKGVTFDSGGLSLKTNDGMVDMKCDMAGAAAVLAGVRAVAELKLPVHVLGVLALVENLPSGKALKLGDVLRARNGKTIEVLNTDAEGRLILADALSYAVDQQAAHLVDLATLTGSCMIALGTEVAGLMSNHDAWAEQVLQAAGRGGERLWRLPLFPFYGESIKSSVADIKNVTGNRWAGAITAAKFLEHFVADVPWAHLDIAGPAWAEHESPARDPGGTGYGVRTLVELARAYRA